MKARVLTVVLLATAAVGLQGCKRSATGQVVAVVNGEEVSLSELNGELQTAPPQAAGDKQVVRTAALQSLIDRKLLVQAAQKRGIDKDPEYLQQQRRMNDQLMISMLARQVTKNIPVPTPGEINAYIASHPTMFAGRTVYALDQVGFAAPAEASKLKALEADHTMDAVIKTLGAQSIPFARQRGVLDTATAPQDLVRQIVALPAGEPFVISTGGKVIVSSITEKKIVPVDGDNAKRLAAEAIRRDAVSKIAQDQIKQARDGAKIEYQPGFNPTGAAGKAKA